MKRLKNLLLKMDTKEQNYTKMYEGPIFVNQSFGPSYEDYDNVYFSENIGFKIERTHKLALDKPTVTIQIPVDLLGIDKYELLKKCKTAAADHCYRCFCNNIKRLNEDLYNRSRPDNENGKYYSCDLGGEILLRNTAFFLECIQKDYVYESGYAVRLVCEDVSSLRKLCLCFRIQVQLPKGKIKKTIQMLCRDLPNAVQNFILEFNYCEFEKVLELADKQNAIRRWLKNSEYCAFIANGSILPREKGTYLPLKNAVPFISPPNDEIEIYGIRGMGIKKGVTVITGGGYSGKSTLLSAISSGVYDHKLGDGRELCITDESAVAISAEDGRSVKNVNISPFIKWLPYDDVNNFSTDHASGSTSQATNIMEAIDCGANLLLIDEDKSATNFMIRDRIMKELIKEEPIVPFTDRVGELYFSQGVSTILVIGGSAEFLAVADHVYLMENYTVKNVTNKAKSFCYDRNDVEINSAKWLQNRVLNAKDFSPFPNNSGSERLEVFNEEYIIIGDEIIDIGELHNIVCAQQVYALGFILRYIELLCNKNKVVLKEYIDDLYSKIEKEELDIVYTAHFTSCERFLACPRKQELYALINRMRNINFENIGKNNE